MNKLFLVLALLFALSACSVGKKCTYTQDGTKISSYVWFYSGDKPIDLDKINELQNVEASKITFSKINTESKKTQIFYNHDIYSYIFTSIFRGT